MHISVDLPAAGASQTVACSLELAWLGPEHLRGQAGVPHLVFLHEGLGSVAMWRDYPARLMLALNAQRAQPCVGLVYSRPGYGASTPRPAAQRWQPNFMHHQAQQVLPALLARLGINAARMPLVLVGHSDGGSIALLHAACFAGQPSQAPAAVVALAPHVFVEPICLASIAQATALYRSGNAADPLPGQAGQTTGLRARLAKYHLDVDSAFFGWSDVWLSPAFASWNIEAEVAKIICPVLAIQGENDEYGTMAQIERIAHGVPKAQLLKLAACGHSPHRDQAQAVTQAIVDFVSELTL